MHGLARPNRRAVFTVPTGPGGLLMEVTMQNEREAIRRYPRLLRQLTLSGFSTNEAACAIEGAKRGDEYGCEAVAHSGGATSVIRHSIRWRHAPHRRARRPAAA